MDTIWQHMPVVTHIVIVPRVLMRPQMHTTLDPAPQMLAIVRGNAIRVTAEQILDNACHYAMQESQNSTQAILFLIYTHPNKQRRP